MRLKNYKPAKNEVLLELKHFTKINNMYTPKPQADKIMKVLAVGPMCSATKVGDLVLLNSTPMAQLEFDAEKVGDKPIIALQGMEYNIMAYYTPDEDETQYFVPVPNGEPVERQGPQNIIDGPGIDHAPFLRDQEEFIKNL